MSSLEGKVAVITGGSSGIGLATAKRFVREGAYVFITGRRESELVKAKAEIGKNVSTVQGDVSSLDDLDRLYATVKADARTWYDSPSYQAAVKFRHAGSKSKAFIIEGVSLAKL